MKKNIAVLLFALFAFTACSGVDTLMINDAKKNIVCTFGR